MSRQALSPRQGVAVTRFQDRILLLSYGEGGIHLLKEIPETESSSALDGQVEAEGLLGRTGPEGSGLRGGETALSFPRVLSRIRRAAGMGAMSLLLLAATAHGPALTAQTSSGVPVPPREGAATPVQEVDPGSRQAPAGPTAEGALMGLARQLPSMDLTVGEEEGLSVSGPVGTVLFIGFLTLLPTVLLLMTGFTRILVVLHLLKQAMGTQTAPPAHLLAAMALLLTGFVMAPTLAEVNRTALAPWLEGEMDEVQMMQTASIPFRAFMVETTGDDELATFLDMRGGEAPETVDDIPMVVLASAFVTSELRQAFQIGFALFLPFVVIDVVVASVLMSMGMFMLPPVMVSLPFKLLLFVLVDGWSLVVGGLVQSFQ
jgi:flagellar biosynthetic protein FliP